MSVSRTYHNQPARASLKQPLTVSNVAQNSDRQKDRSYAPPPKRMSKDSGNDGFYQPPDKRRKTEQSGMDGFDDWGDDDFTEDQLENIDEMVMLSQQVRQDKTFDGNYNNNSTKSTAKLSSRALGKGTNRSQSASDVQSRAHNVAATFPSNTAARSTQGAGHQHRKPTTTGGGARLQSTPVTGASGQGGQSPNMPVSCASTSYNKDLDSLRAQKDSYKKEAEDLRKMKETKEGQIKILTKKLNEKEVEVNNLQKSRNEQMEQAKVERSDLEKNMQKEIEKLQAQLQFKEQELTQLEGNCRRLERRANQSTGGTDSPRHPVSPRRPVPVSPKPSTRSSPRVARKSRENTPVGKGFPNQASFMADERRTSVRKSLNVTPQPSPAKASTSKSGENEHSMAKSAGKKTMKMKLKTALMCDKVPNASLVSKIVADSTSETEGLVNLLHAPPLPREISDLKLNHPNDTFISDHRLNQMMKSKESPGVPKKTNIPHIVTPVNYQLAVSGLTLMLESDQKDFDTQCTNSVLSATSEHAVLILPLLDRYLSSYVWVLKNSTNSGGSKIGYGDSEGSMTQAVSGSLDSLTSSLRSLLLRGENAANLLESSAINTLKVLYNLVKYSAHVQHALVCDSYPKTSEHPRTTTEVKQTLKEGSTSEGHPKTTKENKDEEMEDRPIDDDLGSRAGAFLDIVSKKLNIRKSLILLAQPQLENKDPANVEVVLLSLKILTLLVGSCKTQAEFQMFDMLMHSSGQSESLVCGPLLNCLIENNLLPKPSYYYVLEATLDVMTALANNLQSVWEMCNTDDCLLSAVYSLHCYLEGMNDHHLKSRVTLKLIEFLSAISCQHKRNVSLLFGRSCKCRQEVVKGVVVTLYEELLRWRHLSTRISVMVLRKGITLLHSFLQQDKLFKRRHRDPAFMYFKELGRGLDNIICAIDDGSVDTEVLTAQVKEVFDDRDSPEAMEQE